LSTAAFHVGGRLIATDGAGAISVLEPGRQSLGLQGGFGWQRGSPVTGAAAMTAVDPGGQSLARQVGFEWQVGSRVTTAEMERLAHHMAQAVLSLAKDEKPKSEFERLWLTPPISGLKNYDAVIFSGGVGEYVYGKESKSFGDLGAPLGQALQHHSNNGALPWPLVPARECIRATVMGASQHTVQVSGNTIHRTDESLLPQKNLQVLRPDVNLNGDIVSATVAEGIPR